MEKTELKTDEINEKTGLRLLQNDFSKIINMLNAITKVVPGRIDSLDKVEAALSKLPAGETLGKSIDESREKINNFINVARRERALSFKRFEADFIRTVREQKHIREMDQGWRVGALEIQVKREQSQIRFLYNKEVIMGWQPVGNREDVDKAEERALAMLKESELPADVLMEIFWDAYEHAKESRRKAGEDYTQLVPILDFYREVRLALFRYQLKGKKLDKKLSHADFPRWAFLYNLDHYRLRISDIPEEKRLGFQTGSQKDVSSGMGVVINGLDAREDYKVICYVIPVGGAGA
ncbi:MAG: hypothetical protein WC364_11175 [Eubacteriales bacterium]|jgi:hypothetical protein